MARKARAHKSLGAVQWGPGAKPQVGPGGGQGALPPEADDTLAL